MEQPCYKCGQAVEEGIPFCPHCSAPQIRVVMAEPALNLSSAAALTTSTVDVPSTPSLAIPMSWSQSVRPCAVAAAIAAVAMVLKLVVPLIAILGAGFLAVAFYRRSVPDAALGARAGARLGALCGFFAFAIAAILSSLKIILLHQGDEIRRQMLDAIQQAAVRYPDPQAQPTLDFMRSPAGLVVMMVFFLVFAFLAFLILGSAGGALGGVAFGSRDKK